MILHAFSTDPARVMPFQERDLPKPEDRATALTILEWAYEDEDARRASGPMFSELRRQAETTAWATDRKAWSIVYGLALKLWEIAYHNHKQGEDKKLRVRDLF